MEQTGLTTTEALAATDPALPRPGDITPMGRRDSQRVIGGVVGGRYTIEQRLGRGTAGVVYLARHQDTGGHVALKLLRREHVNNARVLSRFIIEAKHLHRLHHPNTVRLFDYGQTDDGVPFLVMEYLVGTSLQSILDREGALSPDRVLVLAEQVLKSLGEAHSHNVVHRDVKPANIMVSAEFGDPDFVKVVDFGIACLHDGEAAGADAGPVGSPICMAPEQWTARDVDGRTDLYALGCVMYHMLTGRPPFVFRGPSRQIYVRYMFAHLNQTPPTPLDLVPGVCPKPLSDMVMHLLEKDPADRPANAHHALAELDGIRARYRFGEGGWTDGHHTDGFQSVDGLARRPTGTREPPASLVARLKRRVATVTGTGVEAPPPPPAAPAARATVTYGVIIALLACLIGGYALVGSWLFLGDAGLPAAPAVSTAVDAPAALGGASTSVSPLP